MKTYILKGVDSRQRQALASSGTVFHDWGNDVLVEEPQLAPAMLALGASPVEGPADGDGLIAVSLVYLYLQQAKPEAANTVTTQTRPVDPKYVLARAAYIASCNVRLEQIKKDAHNAMLASRASLPAGQKHFFSLCRFLACDKGSRQGLEARFAAEFERIVSIPKVVSLRVITGALLVYTKTLSVSVLDSGCEQRHELGDFLIVIGTDGKGEPVRWLNRTRRVAGICDEMNAPTVFADGVAINTELKETLAELVATFDFAVAVELAIQFVETVEGELARFASRWPLVGSANQGELQ